MREAHRWALGAPWLLAVMHCLGACTPAALPSRMATAAFRDASPTACGRLRSWKMPEGDAFGDPRLPANNVLVTRARLGRIADQAEAWCRSTGRYPATVQELIDGPRAKDVPRVCRIHAENAVDGWERPFAIIAPSDSIRIVSAGPDGVSGTADDITVPPPAGEPSTAPEWEFLLKLGCAPR